MLRCLSRAARCAGLGAGSLPLSCVAPARLHPWLPGRGAGLPRRLATSGYLLQQQQQPPPPSPGLEFFNLLQQISHLQQLIEQLLREASAEKERLLRKASENERQMQQQMEQQMERLMREAFHKQAQLNKQLHIEHREYQAIANLLLQARDCRNIRGALALAGQKLHIANSSGRSSRGSPSTQVMLNALESDAAFMSRLQCLCRQHQLQLSDVLTCLRHLYYTSSKDKHGSEAHVFIREAEIKSPSERAALAAVFEWCSIRYLVVDARGWELLASPYSCSTCMPGEGCCSPGEGK